MTRLLVLGHGRMGQRVESLAADSGGQVVRIITGTGGPMAIECLDVEVDVAIDFTTPDAVLANVVALSRRGINVVIGTTGWHAVHDEVHGVVMQSGIGALAASNFSIGLHVFRRAVAAAAAGFSPDARVGAWVHDAHHNQKKDAPSGTAITLRTTMEEAGYTRVIDMSSTRAGCIPGTHTVGFDGPSETVTLTHTVRDRAVFARGALDVARWLVGRRGWFTMDDYLNDQGETRR